MGAKKWLKEEDEYFIQHIIPNSTYATGKYVKPTDTDEIKSWDQLGVQMAEAMPAKGIAARKEYTGLCLSQQCGRRFSDKAVARGEASPLYIKYKQDVDAKAAVPSTPGPPRSGPSRSAKTAARRSKSDSSTNPDETEDNGQKDAGDSLFIPHPEGYESNQPRVQRQPADDWFHFGGATRPNNQFQSRRSSSKGKGRTTEEEDEYDMLENAEKRSIKRTRWEYEEDDYTYNNPAGHPSHKSHTQSKAVAMSTSIPGYNRYGEPVEDDFKIPQRLPSSLPTLPTLARPERNSNYDNRDYEGYASTSLKWPQSSRPRDMTDDDKYALDFQDDNFPNNYSAPSSDQFPRAVSYNGYSSESQPVDPAILLPTQRQRSYALSRLIDSGTSRERNQSVLYTGPATHGARTSRNIQERSHSVHSDRNPSRFSTYGRGDETGSGYSTGQLAGPQYQSSYAQGLAAPIRSMRGLPSRGSGFGRPSPAQGPRSAAGLTPQAMQDVTAFRARQQAAQKGKGVEKDAFVDDEDGEGADEL